MSKRIWWLVSAVVLAVFALLPAARGEAYSYTPTTAHIAGVVTGPSGVAVESTDVTATVRFTENGLPGDVIATVTTTTAADGSYSLDIPSGLHYFDASYHFEPPSGSGFTPITCDMPVAMSRTLNMQFDSGPVCAAYLTGDALNGQFYLRVDGFEELLEFWEGPDPGVGNGTIDPSRSSFGGGASIVLLYPEDLTPGYHNFQVRAGSQVLSVDITVPMTLTQTSLPNQLPSFSWEPVAGAVEYLVSSGQVVTASTSFTDTEAHVGQEGAVPYMVAALDATGYPVAFGTLRVTFDLTVPVVSVISVTPEVINVGETSNLFMLTKASDVASAEYYIDTDPGVGNAIPLPLVLGRGNATLSNVPAGVHTIYVRVIDVSGNIGAASTLLTVNQAAPAAPTDLTAASPTNQPVLSWTGAAGADHYDVFRDSDPAAIGTTTGTSFTDTAMLTEGNHTYIVTAVSATNVASDPSNSVLVVVDTTAPVLATPTWSQNPKTISQPTTFSVPVSDNLAGVTRGEYYLGDTDPGVGNGTALTLNSGTLTTTFGTNFQPGIYKVNTRAQDMAGNWSLTASDYLVVFDPSGPTNVAASKKVVPQLANGDILPGLLSDTQSDKANLAFDVSYTAIGTINAASTLNLEYETGHACNSPHPANCHTTTFAVTTVTPNVIDWLTITGTNSSIGTFRGQGTLTIDGVVTVNPFKVQAIDGNRTTPVTSDDAVIYIYPTGTNPDTATALFQLHIQADGNWMKIQ